MGLSMNAVAQDAKSDDVAEAARVSAPAVTEAVAGRAEENDGTGLPNMFRAGRTFEVILAAFRGEGYEVRVPEDGSRCTRQRARPTS